MEERAQVALHGDLSVNVYCSATDEEYNRADS